MILNAGVLLLLIGGYLFLDGRWAYMLYPEKLTELIKLIKKKPIPGDKLNNDQIFFNKIEYFLYKLSVLLLGIGCGLILASLIIIY